MTAPTPEERYWSRFSSQLLLPCPAAVSHITVPAATDAGASKQPDFAVTSGHRVQVYSSRTRKVTKTIARFGVDDTAHSGHVRRDGRIVVAGGDSGAIQAFDVHSRAILKTWREHKQPVWLTAWSPSDLTTLMSASDDRTVRLWDLPASASTTTFVGHQDYVRSGAFMPGRLDRMLVTGSYDQTVRLWDPRIAGRAVMVFKHAAAVESVLPLPSGAGVVAAAANQLSVLDLVAGKPSHLLRNHQKTVTSLSLASEGTRVVSGALDGHVKILETAGWSVVAGSKYPSPILSLCVVPSGRGRDDKHLVVGMHSGLLSIKTRLSGQEKVQARERERQLRAMIDGTADQLAARSRKRGRGWQKEQEAKKYAGGDADIIVDVQRKRKGPKDRTGWRTALKKGQYEKALNGALDVKAESKQADIMSVITELQHRSALRTALGGRDEVTLRPVLKWLIKAVGRPQHSQAIVDVACLVLDIYAADMADSPVTWKLVRRLHENVIRNVELAQESIKIQGMMDLIAAG